MNRRDPKRVEHPKSVYIICLLVMMIMLFVLGGVINHFAFSEHGPGLLVPLLEKFQEKELPEATALKRHQKAEAQRHFHNIPESSGLPGGFHTDCTICHSTLPHSKTEKVRSVLNMHSKYLSCEACHAENKANETFSYAWYSPLEKNPKGPFFGTAFDSKSGELLYIHNHESKIVPFRGAGSEMEPILYVGLEEEAMAFVKVRSSLTDERRKEVTEKFHREIRPKGLECQACHSLDGILDYKKLGFSETRITDLQKITVQGLFIRHDTFHVPDLFNLYSDTAPDSESR